MTESENIPLGALFILLASLALALMGALIKKIGTTLPNEVIVFMRYGIAFLGILPFILLPKPKDLKTTHLTNHIIRAAAGVAVNYALYYAIAHILLSDAILLNNTMPLFVPFVMYFWKGESIPKKIFLPLLISFLGVVIILRPSPNLFHVGSIFALLSGLLMAISSVGVRTLKSEPFYRITFYLFFIGFLISLVPLLWKWQTPTKIQVMILCGVAFFGFFYQYLVLLAYRVATPTKVSPLIYASVIFSGLLEWLVWGVIPHLLSIVGLVLVFVGAYFCMKIEHKAHPNE